MDGKNEKTVWSFDGWLIIGLLFSIMMISIVSGCQQSTQPPVCKIDIRINIDKSKDSISEKKISKNKKNTDPEILSDSK